MLALPVAASAQNFDPIIVPNTPWDDLPISGTTTPVTTLVTSSTDDGYVSVQLPFAWVFFNEVFTQINVSTNGFITFGTNTAGATVYSNVTIPSTADPNGMVALWWDDDACPAGSIKTQEYGAPGSRWFVVEWNGCTRGGTLQMQVRLQENSPIVRTFYGAMGTTTTTNSATVGIENPPGYDPVTGAQTVAGGTRGYVPTLTPACSNNANCTAASWPTNTMIQYGRPNLPDLGPGRNGIYSGARITSLTKASGTMTAVIENNIGNDGLQTASNVVWNYYLSADTVWDASDPVLPCNHTNPETVPGWRSPPAGASFSDTCVFTAPPAGAYRICAYIDPANTVLEANDNNNTFCTDEFVLGSDLVGSVQIESTGGLGSFTDVGVHIENRGSDPTGEFAYQVFWKDCNDLNQPGQLFYSGTMSLNGGQSQDQNLEIFLEANTEGNTICAELVIDPANAINELVESNNTASTCRDPGKVCMTLTRPDLDVNTLAASMPHGCFFGDLVTLDLEVCNNGPTLARNFGVVFNVDTNSIVTLLDTKVIALPQACSNHDPVTGAPFDDSSLCMDIGGGAPTCLNGICHPPCLADADCGGGGLECAEDPALPRTGDGALVKSCQLMLPGGECKWIRTTTNLPTYDSRGQADFTDGYYFFGSIVDWTTVISEVDEGNNKQSTADKYFCWTRKPDFQPTEIRSVGVLGAGEVVPVYHRVHNNGVVGGVYSYRYVLTSNATASVHDIPLELVDGGEIADATVDPFGDSVRTDMVRIPAGVVPGDYYVGIIVDPLDTVLELSETNNALVWCDLQADASCAPHSTRLVDSSLRVLTTALRDATVGQSYNVQLLATGGNGNYAWVLTSGVLPPGMILEPSGLLHGTALEQGYYPFQVTVTSGAASTPASFTIHATPARGPLAVTTDSLPTAYIDVPYLAELGASGGAPPYTWTCSGVPTWATLNNNIISGTPHAAATAVEVRCTLTDANLSSLEKSYPLAVFAQSNLAIKTRRLDDWDVGVPGYVSYVTAEGGSGNYAWTFDTATIPAGLEVLDASNRGAIQGTPMACGSFLVGVSVRDTATNATDSAELPLTILCDVPRLTTRNLPVAVRGDIYPDQQLAAEGAVSFEAVLGELPRGLELSRDGLISGTVAVDANPGDYNVAIEMTDSYGGKGLGAVTIVVQDPAAPKVIVTDKKNEGGCSTSGEGSAAGFLPFAALFALLGLRRTSVRRSAGVALVAAAAALLPAVASAQTTKGYASYERSVVFQRLTDSTPVPGLTDLDNGSPAVTLPFSFTFFGEVYDRVYVSTNGVLLFSAASTSSTNYGIPSSSTPNNFIAPWFDDIDVAAATDLRYSIRGTEPNREIVFQWVWLTGYSTSDGDAGGEMQVSLFQDGTVAMRWGRIKDNGYSSYDFQATVGLEDANASGKSVPYLACSNTTGGGKCSSADWNNNLADKEVVFTTLPNLAIASASTAAEGRAGLQQDFSVTLTNNGPKPVTTSLHLYASSDDRISDDDVSIGEIPDFNVPAFAGVTGAGNPAAVTVHLNNAVLPRVLAAGSYYLLARADPRSLVQEWNEADNDGGAFHFVVVPPMPDLALDWIGVPSSGNPGSMISVDLTVSNLGNDDAVNVPYVVVLSQNEAITGSDLPLYQGTLTVGWQETAEITNLVEVPANIPAGVYYIGAVIDPAALVAEFDKLNNIRGTGREFRVTTDGLRVDTQVPVELQVGAPFCIPLQAEGGDGVYTWTLVDGQLPPGVTLNPGGEADPTGASLCGEPSTVGIFDFTLQVESGGMTRETQLSLNVVVVPVQLTIASKSLPLATFQNAYEAGLSVNGGRPPFHWELASGTLPAGLTFASDGLLFGTPLQDGTYNISVKVTDAATATATESLRLIVAPPARVTCSSRTLGTLPVSVPYTGELLAGGAGAPYIWSTIGTQRFGDAGGEDIPEGSGPPGLNLGSTGEVTGAPREIGRYLWTVQVTDKDGRNPDTCAISLEVVAGQGLTVTTTALPVALVDNEYSVQLAAAGGVGTLRWSPLDLGLPSGLGLSENGVISGKLTTTDLQNLDSRTYSFLVEVRDDQNNRGVGSLSVTLKVPQQGSLTHVTETTTSGCSTSAGGFSLVALGLVVLGLRRRR